MNFEEKIKQLEGNLGERVFQKIKGYMAEKQIQHIIEEQDEEVVECLEKVAAGLFKTKVYTGEERRILDLNFMSSFAWDMDLDVGFKGSNRCVMVEIIVDVEDIWEDMSTFSFYWMFSLNKLNGKNHAVDFVFVNTFCYDLDGLNPEIDNSDAGGDFDDVWEYFKGITCTETERTEMNSLVKEILNLEHAKVFEKQIELIKQIPGLKKLEQELEKVVLKLDHMTAEVILESILEV